MGKRSSFARRERDSHSFRHGHNCRGERTSEYEIWAGIKQRTGNQANKLYPYYGGRGVTMCARWQDDFEAFLNDVGVRPSAHHSLDRIDNSKDYQPDNVRWATRTEQSRNRRNNIIVTFRGIDVCLSEACEMAGQPYKRVWRRMRGGWSFDRAIQPIEARHG